MKAIPIEAGRVVVSTQGHDRGRAFLVVAALDERYVTIADGDTRKVASPKKKQIKHVRPAPHTFPEALSAPLIRAGAADAAVRKALGSLAKQGKAGADRITNKEEYALVQE